jgi:hypothetical protein
MSVSSTVFALAFLITSLNFGAGFRVPVREFVEIKVGAFSNEAFKALARRALDTGDGPAILGAARNE